MSELREKGVLAFNQDRYVHVLSSSNPPPVPSQLVCVSTHVGWQVVLGAAPTRADGANRARM